MGGYGYKEFQQFKQLPSLVKYNLRRYWQVLSARHRALRFVFVGHQLNAVPTTLPIAIVKVAY